MDNYDELCENQPTLTDWFESMWAHEELAEKELEDLIIGKW